MHRKPPPDWLLTRRRAFGAHLRPLRRTAGLTQEQLGELADRDAKSISRWENGHRAPDLDDLIALAHALGIPLPDLVR